MKLKVLLVGGTGQISMAVLLEALRAGHDVTIFNRGSSNQALPAEVSVLHGDMNDPGSYARLRAHRFDVVCQFMVYKPAQMRQDIDVFTGHVDQYVFISSASAYQKPPRDYVISEHTPLENPYWLYSREKIECEAMLRAQSGLPFTIVRPSHTTRTKLPSMLREGDLIGHRMLAHRPVLVSGDGTSVWTLTRAEDFAKPFVRLFGNPAALGEDFHITADRGHTWNDIYRSLGRALGVEAKLVHVPAETLRHYNPEWEGELQGDRMWTTLFDNSKIKRVAGDFECVTDLDVVLSEAVRHFKARAAAAPHEPGELDRLIDRVAADQTALGR